MLTDIEQLIRDATEAQRRKVTHAPARRRLFASKRVRKFSERLNAHITATAHGTSTGLVSLADRIAEGLHRMTITETSGDYLLNDVLKTITEFRTGDEPFVLRTDQHMMVAHIITSCLPLIYGVKLEANRERILRMLGTRDISESLLIVASRRVGKTTCIAVVVAALLICKPNFLCTVFGMVLKAAHRVMDAIKEFLNMHPRGRALTRDVSNRLVMILTDQEHLSHKKTLEVYPATTNVRSFFLIACVHKVCSRLVHRSWPQKL